VTIRDCGLVFGFCDSNGEEEEEEGTLRGCKGDYLRDGFVFWDTRYGAL
jgi:hypothetical protein